MSLVMSIWFVPIGFTLLAWIVAFCWPTHRGRAWEKLVHGLIATAATGIIWSAFMLWLRGVIP